MFEIGMKVYIWAMRGPSNDQVHTIAKIHRNGNMVLEEGGGQWRADGHSCGRNFSGLRLRPVTPELTAEIRGALAARERLSRVYRLDDRFKHIQRRARGREGPHLTDEFLDQLEAALVLMERTDV